MANFKISLTGDLGSGKSTVSNILKERFGAEIISVGKLQREMAAELNMDTCEFNEYQRSHPEYDKILDAKTAAYESVDGNFIFDSRLAWHFVPGAFSVYLKCEYAEAARRIMDANREDESFSSLEEAEASIRTRRERERSRYAEFYGVDILDMNNYDAVIDTKDKTPEEVADAIVSAWENKINGRQ